MLFLLSLNFHRVKIFFSHIIFLDFGLSFVALASLRRLVVVLALERRFVIIFILSLEIQAWRNWTLINHCLTHSGKLAKNRKFREKIANCREKYFVKIEKFPRNGGEKALEKSWRLKIGNFPIRIFFGNGKATTENNGKMILLFLSFSSSLAGMFKK